MGIKFANNAFGTLNAGISNSATSATLSSGQGARFPTLSTDDYFYATLIDTSNNLEVVKCTARSSDVLTITRAQDNTTARAFAAGDRVELRITAAALSDATSGSGGGFYRGDRGEVGDTSNKGDIFRIHEQQLDTDTTIASTENASCTGPLTIASSTTLTVSGNLVII